MLDKPVDLESRGRLDGIASLVSVVRLDMTVPGKYTMEEDVRANIETLFQCNLVLASPTRHEVQSMGRE